MFVGPNAQFFLPGSRRSTSENPLFLELVRFFLNFFTFFTARCIWSEGF